MKKPDMDLGERAYEPKHIQAVLTEIGKHFPKYFNSFCSSAADVKKAFAKAIQEWEQDAPSYEEFLDLDSLEEYDDDPNAFKNALKRECPIIRRCLNSSANEMKKYKKNFNLSTGRNLLSTTTNIVQFGIDHIVSFDHKDHEKASEVDSLGLSELLEEDYVAYGVIGGGIKSHFLYSRFPYAFPNRSQNALWALYFLTDKKEFGFEDGSEFLMIDTDEEHPQLTRTTTIHTTCLPTTVFASTGCSRMRWRRRAWCFRTSGGTSIWTRSLTTSQRSTWTTSTC